VCVCVQEPYLGRVTSRKKKKKKIRKKRTGVKRRVENNNNNSNDPAPAEKRAYARDGNVRTGYEYRISFRGFVGSGTYNGQRNGAISGEECGRVEKRPRRGPPKRSGQSVAKTEPTAANC